VTPKMDFCDVCGRSVTAHEGNTIIGVQFRMSGEDVQSLYPEIELDRTYQVCPVCWLKALGIKMPPLGMTPAEWKEQNDKTERRINER
jgi:hypothetical protein